MTIKKTTPTTFIQKRDSLVKTIKQDWERIYSNNVFPSGMQQKFDLNAVYKSIIKSETELVKAKVTIQAINMGLKKLSELPEDCVFPSIFTLQQIKERIIKLERIPTKKDEDENIALTRKFVESELIKLNAEKEKIEMELEEYNDNTNFEE